MSHSLRYLPAYPWLSLVVFIGFTWSANAQSADEPRPPTAPPSTTPDAPSTPEPTPPPPVAEPPAAEPPPVPPVTEPPATVPPPLPPVAEPPAAVPPPLPPVAVPTPTPTPPPVAAFPNEVAPSAAPRNGVQPAPTASVAPPPTTAPSPTSSSKPFASPSETANPSAASTSPPPQPESKDDDSDDIFRIGPVVGIGLPSLISLGGMLKLTSYLGGGINVGLIPSTKLPFYGDATISYQEYDVYGRLFPFGGGFFLGAGVGYATVTATLKKDINTSAYTSQLPASLSLPNPLPYESEGSIKTMIVTPQIGYFYTTSIGFSLGIDLGAQIPIAPSKVHYDSTLSLPADTPQTVIDQIQSSYVDPNDKKVEDTLQTLGRAPIPTINLRVGWLF